MRVRICKGVGNEQEKETQPDFIKKEFKERIRFWVRKRKFADLMVNRLYLQMEKRLQKIKENL